MDHLSGNAHRNLGGRNRVDGKADGKVKRGDLLGSGTSRGDDALEHLALVAAPHAAEVGRVEVEYLGHDVLVGHMTVRHDDDVVALVQGNRARDVLEAAEDDLGGSGEVLGTGHLGAIVIDGDLEVDGRKRRHERAAHVAAAKDDTTFGAGDGLVEHLVVP